MQRPRSVTYRAVSVFDIFWPAGAQRAIPAVLGCNTRASILACEFAAGHAF
jgi:hypothetical protein